MNDKIFIRVYVPSLLKKFEIFIPYNEKIDIIIKDCIKVFFELSDGRFNVRGKFILANKNSGVLYSKNQIIIDTDIRNGTELLLLEEQ